MVAEVSGFLQGISIQGWGVVVVFFQNAEDIHGAKACGLAEQMKTADKELGYQATCYKLTLKVMASLQKCQV